MIAFFSKEPNNLQNTFDMLVILMKEQFGSLKKQLKNSLFLVKNSCQILVKIFHFESVFPLKKSLDVGALRESIAGPTII